MSYSGSPFNNNPQIEFKCVKFFNSTISINRWGFTIYFDRGSSLLITMYTLITDAVQV